MSEFVIEKNVPIPEDAIVRKNAKYPFHLLEVKDSFKVTGDKTVVARALNAYHSCRKRSPRKTFMYSYEHDGIRFWRVA